MGGDSEEIGIQPKRITGTVPHAHGKMNRGLWKDGLVSTVCEAEVSSHRVRCGSDDHWDWTAI